MHKVFNSQINSQTMEQEIIPVQNIAFAVLDDGSYIANFRKPNGGGVILKK